MDRNPRRAKTLLTIVLVLTSLAAGMLWLRGYFARDGIWFTTQTTRYGLHAYRGRVWFWRLTAKPNPTATVWATPARVGAGWAWDSAPDKWYDRFPRGPRGVQLPGEFLDAAAQGGGTDRGILGFRYVRSDRWFPRAQLMFGYPTAESTAVYVPLWAVLTVTAVIPATTLFKKARASRRSSRGLCPACGYDLRASAGRCPECGTGVA